MPLSAQEQYLLELINRGRLDPLAEAARYGIDLNAGLAAGTISAAPKQALAPNALLENAAVGHSKAMLAGNFFSHTGKDGSTLGSRATAAGYQWNTLGENIALWGTSGVLNQTDAINAHHRGLFLSAGHRTNLMANAFNEVGLAQEIGPYKSANGSTMNASLLTENFGAQNGKKFITGVMYNDSNGDNFYSVGEGIQGTLVIAAGQEMQSEAAGGYAINVGQVNSGLVMGVANGLFYSLTVDYSIGNVKLDIVNGNTYFTSGSVVIASGINNVTLLGIGNNTVTGNEANNFMIGNEGNNDLIGHGGNDVIYAMGGNDGLRGGAGHDHYLGGNGNDFLFGDTGLDYLHGEDGQDILNGGADADWFVFANTNDADVVQDFALSQGDKLRLNDDLWTGSLTNDQIVARFATVTSAGVVFNFGDGDTLTLQGVTSTAGLAGAILIW